MSEILKTPEQQGSATETTSPQVEKKTPNKRGRMSFIERAQKESEELVKNMGGSLELEGGRRTRSSARGTPSRSAVVTPPPIKKVRSSPASPKSTTPRARGRGRKLGTTATPEPPEPQQNKDEEEKVDDSTTKQVTTPEKIEKSETNGPEKAEEEHANDVTEKKTAPEVQKEDKEKKPVKEINETDQVDAVLDVAQDKQNSLNEEEKVEPEKSKSKDAVPEKEEAAIVGAANVDSPMEVDEQSLKDSKSDTVENTEVKEVKETLQQSPSRFKVEKVPEPIIEPISVAEKQPTPEPMEVDSSSKSSDVVECTTDAVDKAESRSSIEQSNVIVNESNPVADKKISEILTPSQVNSEANGTTGTVGAVNEVKENDIAIVKSTDAPAAAEESKFDIVTESNSEKTKEEPKVTSSQLSGTGDAVATTI